MKKVQFMNSSHTDFFNLFEIFTNELVPPLWQSECKISKDIDCNLLGDHVNTQTQQYFLIFSSQ